MFTPEHFKVVNLKTHLTIKGLGAGRYFVASRHMRIFIGLSLWFILFVICWPLALVTLVLFPFIWLILLPFRLVGFTLEAVFKFIGALLMIPFRILGIR